MLWLTAPVAQILFFPYYEAMSLLGYVRTLRDERRAFGWKGLLRKRGWKLVALFVAYYLIRDVILYVILPIAVAAGLRR